MISKEEVQNLAALARLELSDAELESLGHDISSILDYVGQVSKVAIEDDVKTAPEHHNVFRADLPRTAGDLLYGKEAAVQAAFPKSDAKEGEGIYNVVRKIIQKDE